MILNRTFFRCLLEEFHCCRVRILKIYSGGSPNTASVCRMYRDWYTRNGKNQEEQNVGKVYFTPSLTSAFSSERKTDIGNICKLVKNLSNKIVVVNNLYNLSHFYGGCSPVGGLLLVYAPLRL